VSWRATIAVALSSYGDPVVIVQPRGRPDVCRHGLPHRSEEPPPLPENTIAAICRDVVASAN